MHERYIRWWTPHLSRDFEMLVFGDGRGLPLILFPTSYGRFYQNKEFGLIESIRWFVETGRVTVYCPDSADLDSWYNQGIHPADRVRTQMGYENVIVHDVFDFARRREAATGSPWVGRASGRTTRPTSLSEIPTGSATCSAWAGRSTSSGSSAVITTTTCSSTTRPITSPNARTRGSTATWASRWAPANGTSAARKTVGSQASSTGKGIRHLLDERRWCAHDWNWWREMLPYYLSLM